MNGDINIHIDKIVLHGLSANDTEGLRSAVTEELTRLFAMNGIPPALSAEQGFPHIAGRNISIHSNEIAGHIGTSIAGSVYDGLSGTNSGPGRNPTFS